MQGLHKQLQGPCADQCASRKRHMHSFEVLTSTTDQNYCTSTVPSGHLPVVLVLAGVIVLSQLLGALLS
jgi:hypothetical protein